MVVRYEVEKQNGTRISFMVGLFAIKVVGWVRICADKYRGDPRVKFVITRAAHGGSMDEFDHKKLIRLCKKAALACDGVRTHEHNNQDGIDIGYRCAKDEVLLHGIPFMRFGQQWRIQLEKLDLEGHRSCIVEPIGPGHISFSEMIDSDTPI